MSTESETTEDRSVADTWEGVGYYRIGYTIPTKAIVPLIPGKGIRWFEEMFGVKFERAQRTFLRNGQVGVSLWFREVN